MSGRTFSLVNKNTNQPTKLTSLDVKISVSGFLSKTSVTMVFYNETENETEGELQFPMAEGAVLSGYAVDMNGVLVDGVVVEKEKARVTFESEARDVVEKPSVSIAEHVVGNVFKTRVFPLPRKATRTIKVTYVEELNTNNGQAIYSLPLYFSYPIQSYKGDITVDIIGNLNPIVEADMGMKDLSKVATSNSNDGQESYNYNTKWNVLNQTITKGIILTIPKFKQRLIIEKENDTIYFAINDSVNVPISVSDVSPSSVGVLWDASYSRRDKQSRRKDIEILKDFIIKLRNVQINLYIFRDEFEDALTFEINNFQCEKLIEKLESIEYDGGTSFIDLPVTGRHPYYILFSDGISSMSDEATNDLRAPVYVVSTAEESDTNFLKVLARRSGGEYFKVSLDTNTAAIVNKIGKSSYSFISASYDRSVISDIYPSIPTSIPTSIQGSSFKIAGKIIKPLSQYITIQLNYGYGVEATHQVQYKIKPREGLSTGLVSRFWAQRKIDELQLFPEVEENQKLILEIGRTFSIVTPNTSLIVLETLDQYLKYDIEPPKNLRFYSEWCSIMDEKKSMNMKGEENRIAEILPLWRRRVAWWNDDMSNLEVNERYIIHCFEYGRGIDFVEKDLSDQWDAYRLEREFELYKSDLRKKKLEEEEKKRLEEAKRELEKKREERRRYLEEKKKKDEARRNEEMRRREEERLRKEELEIQLEEERIRKEIEMKKREEEFKRIFYEEERRKKEEYERRIEEERLCDEEKKREEENESRRRYQELKEENAKRKLEPQSTNQYEDESIYHEKNAEEATRKLKERIAARKQEILKRKKVKEEEEIMSYMKEEKAAEDTSRTMKERIEARKRELVEKKKAQEEEQMMKYMAEERASEEASRAMKERIESRKRELEGKKKGQEEEQMMRYMEEEKASEEASRTMKERIEARKRELEEKKKGQEEEQMMRYMAEERASEEASRAMKEKSLKEDMYRKEAELERLKNFDVQAMMKRLDEMDRKIESKTEVLMSKRLDVGNFETKDKNIQNLIDQNKALLDKLANSNEQINMKMNSFSPKSIIPNANEMQEEDRNKRRETRKIERKEGEMKFEAERQRRGQERDKRRRERDSMQADSPIPLAQPEPQPITPSPRKSILSLPESQPIYNMEGSLDIGSSDKQDNSSALKNTLEAKRRALNEKRQELEERKKLLLLKKEARKEKIIRETNVMEGKDSDSPRENIPDPLSLKYSSWAVKQKTWTEFEKTYYNKGQYFLQKWTQDHHEYKNTLIAKEISLIQDGDRINTFNPNFSRETSHLVITIYDQQSSSSLNDYKAYLEAAQISSNNKNLIFYVDTAQNFIRNGMFNYGSRILSNLSELEIQNIQFLRLLAYKLESLGEKCSLKAVEIYRRILKLRPEEPQSFLFLALTLIKNATTILFNLNEKKDFQGLLTYQYLKNPIEQVKKQYKEALELLEKVIMGKWDKRFAQVEVVALMELNRLIYFVDFFGLQHHVIVQTDRRFLSPIEVDLRVYLVWDTDMTDLEMEVMEPTGEKCNSFNNKTSIGGMVSRNFTHGYGPQEYLLRTAVSGPYRIYLKLCSSMEKYTGTTALVKIFKYYGDPRKEVERVITYRFHKDGEIHKIADIDF